MLIRVRRAAGGQPLLPAPHFVVSAVVVIVVLSVLVVVQAQTRCDPRLSTCDPLVETALRTAGWVQAHPAIFQAATDGATRFPLTLAGFGCALAFAVLRRPRGAVLSLIGPWAAVVLDDRIAKRIFGGSFPSGRAAALFALASVVVLLVATTPLTSRPLRWTFRAVLAISIAVAWTMSSAVIATGTHPPVDVVGGACFGVVVVLIAALLIDAAARPLARGHRPTPSPRGPLDEAIT